MIGGIRLTTLVSRRSWQSEVCGVSTNYVDQCLDCNRTRMIACKSRRLCHGCYARWRAEKSGKTRKRTDRKAYRECRACGQVRLIAAYDLCYRCRDRAHRSIVRAVIGAYQNGVALPEAVTYAVRYTYNEVDPSDTPVPHEMGQAISEALLSILMEGGSEDTKGH